MSMETPEYELHIVPGQFDEDDTWSMTGSSIEERLRNSGLLSRAFSVEDPLVQNWIENPRTYPEELRECQVVTLWGLPHKGSDENRLISNLMWNNRVIVCWVWLGNEWGSTRALLHPNKTK